MPLHDVEAKLPAKIATLLLVGAIPTDVSVRAWPNWKGAGPLPRTKQVRVLSRGLGL